MRLKNRMLFFPLDLMLLGVVCLVYIIHVLNAAHHMDQTLAFCVLALFGGRYVYLLSYWLTTPLEGRHD